jgi:hypothetical protein
MAGFQNDTNKQSIGGGFINSSTALEVTSSNLPVPVELISSFPAGGNFVGYFGLQSAIPAGGNNIGSVNVASLPALSLATGQTISITGSLPAGTARLGTVGLDAGTTVSLSSGTSVSITGGVGVTGSVGITSLPSVAINSLPNINLATGQTIGVTGSVGITGTPTVAVTSMPQVTLVPGQTINANVTISNVTLLAGAAKIGSVDIASAIPAGNNKIGSVDIASSLPTGTNTIGRVTVADGAKTEQQGRDQTGALKTIATDGQGAVMPPVVTVNETIVTLLANQSTTILVANPARIMYKIQMVNLDNVVISESGSTLTSLDSPGTLILSGGIAGAQYAPVFVSTLKITALCLNTTTVRVTEYVKV